MSAKLNPVAVYTYVINAIGTRRTSKNYAEDYCRLKTEFFHLFQQDLVFSTRFGADFFTEVATYLEGNGFIQPDPYSDRMGRPILGDWDKNFNAWLKMARLDKPVQS